MTRLFNREIFLWQAFLIFVMLVTLLFLVGFYFVGKNTEDIEPISKLDREMLRIENQIKVSPKNPDYYVQLGWVYYQKGSILDAKKAYTKALSLRENHPDALYNLGLIFMEEDDFSSAETYLGKIFERNPTHHLAALALGKVYLDSEKYEEAEELLIKFQDEFTTNADYFYYLGLICEKLGKRDEAIKYITKALNFDPKFIAAEVALYRITNLE